MQRRVVAAGTFDGVHLGHESFLTQAKQLGTELTVIVARDQTVERFKGRSPDRSESERLVAIQALQMVDQAVLGSLGGDYLAVITQLQPDVLALGYDQWPNETQLRTDLDTHGLASTKIIRLKPCKPEQYHSSLLRRSQVVDCRLANRRTIYDLRTTNPRRGVNE